MYSTPKGDRILERAERRLYEESLGMMVDLLAEGDVDFGVPAFDELQHGPKLYALYQSGRALLHPHDPVPERVAYLDAAIAAVYQHVYDMVVQEVDDPEFASSPTFWRTLVADAARESESFEAAPNASSEDHSEWECVVDCLADGVLWDRDFEINEHLDADPESASALKAIMGIPAEYHTAVPLDPPNDQLNLYIDALMGLTPRGRGEGISPDAFPDEATDDDLF